MEVEGGPKVAYCATTYGCLTIPPAFSVVNGTRIGLHAAWTPHHVLNPYLSLDLTILDEGDPQRV